MIKPVVIFSEKDLDELKRLRAVIANGDFQIKGNAVSMVANTLAWVESLEIKMQHYIKEDIKKNAPKIKEIK